MELVISIVIGILIVEAYAWMPKISGLLIEREVQRLRREDQNRCREEWRAGLDALPNSVAKLIHALSYLGAANRINGDFFENKLSKINALIEECRRKQSAVAHAWREKLVNSRSKFVLSSNELQLSLSRLEALVAEVLPNEEVTSSIKSLLKSLADARASLKAEGLTRVFRMADRLRHVNDLILRASEKRDRVSELLSRCDGSPHMLDALLGELASDLHGLKGIFEDNNWRDEDALREREHQLSAPETLNANTQ
jgi:hypothetical protein